MLGRPRPQMDSRPLLSVSSCQPRLVRRRTFKLTSDVQYAIEIRPFSVSLRFGPHLCFICGEGCQFIASIVKSHSWPRGMNNVLFWVVRMRFRGRYVFKPCCLSIGDISAPVARCVRTSIATGSGRQVRVQVGGKEKRPSRLASHHRLHAGSSPSPASSRVLPLALKFTCAHRRRKNVLGTGLGRACVQLGSQRTKPEVPIAGARGFRVCRISECRYVLGYASQRACSHCMCRWTVRVGNGS